MQTTIYNKNIWSWICMQTLLTAYNSVKISTQTLTLIKHDPQLNPPLTIVL